MELMAASNQWATRPNDERFTSLTEMKAHFDSLEPKTVSKPVNIATLEAVTQSDKPGSLYLVGPSGNPFAMTDYAFSQLTKKISISTDLLQRQGRDGRGDLAAQNLTWALHNVENDDDARMQVVLRATEDDTAKAQAQAFLSKTYNRISNKSVIDALHGRFGSGVPSDGGDFVVPGIRKVALTEVTKRNTTLFASNRDCFVFLADEKHRIEVPNRRNGETGLLSRGFFVWNSEVGDNTFGVSKFYFDEVCENRIVWGAQGVSTMKFKHTKNVTDKFVTELAPFLLEFTNAAASKEQELITLAQSTKVEKMPELFQRFDIGPRTFKDINNVHISEEARPMETLWDAQVGITAFAKANPFNNERVKLEAIGGKILDLVAN